MPSIACGPYPSMDDDLLFMRRRSSFILILLGCCHHDGRPSLVVVSSMYVQLHCCDDVVWTIRTRVIFQKQILVNDFIVNFRIENVEKTWKRQLGQESRRI